MPAGVSFVIPVLNEGDHIGPLLRHLRGEDVFTWRDDKTGEFPPGMLDVLVHSPDLLPKGGLARSLSRWPRR